MQRLEFDLLLKGLMVVIGFLVMTRRLLLIYLLGRRLNLVRLELMLV